MESAWPWIEISGVQVRGSERTKCVVVSGQILVAMVLLNVVLVLALLLFWMLCTARCCLSMKNTMYFVPQSQPNIHCKLTPHIPSIGSARLPLRTKLLVFVGRSREGCYTIKTTDGVSGHVRDRKVVWSLGRHADR
jgi:hypothetical protein